MGAFINLWFSVRSFKITKLKVHFNLTRKKTTIFGSVAREHGKYTYHVHVYIHISIHTYRHKYIYAHLCACTCTHTNITESI